MARAGRLVKTDSTQKRKASAKNYRNIRDALRDRICLLHCPPGTVLNEADLALEFGVSRTPVRRALQRLEYEGLVQIKDGMGTIVTDVGLMTFKEIFDLRMRLYELMGELSPRPVQETHIKAIEKLIDRVQGLRDRRDFEEFAHIAIEVEKIIRDMIGNAPLREMCELLFYRVARIWLTFLPHLDWATVIDSVEEEFIKMRDAMKRNDLRAVGEIRRVSIGHMLILVSDYMRAG